MCKQDRSEPTLWRCGFRKLVTVLAMACVTLVPSSSWGWGREGHQIVAAVAEDHLDETTKVMIQSLIGNNHLYSIATWADDIRKERRDTAPWHYVDIPLGSTYEATRDCSPPNSCVVVKIADFVKILTDKQANREDRAEALKFVVHFVGDIHQPMHAVGEAKGGNGIHVRFFDSDRCGSYECNLHGVWDTDLIEHTGLNREEYAQHEEELIAANKLDALADGTPEEWANESHTLAEAAWVPDGTDLNEGYYDKQIKVVDRQLALAGLRLAKLLNESIGKMTPRDFAASVPANAREASSPTSELASKTPNETGSGVKVWVNTKSGVYHCPDSRWYGNTKQGEYMSESEAVKSGYHAAGGKCCESTR
jgi:nuclease S1